MEKSIFIDKLINISGVKNVDMGAVSNLYDKIILSKRTGKTIYSNEFYTPNIWSALLKLDSYLDVNFETNGIFDEADRRVVAIGNENCHHYPIKLIKIKSKSKFSSVSHRDFLGSIMALGVKREKFGDLILQEDICYVAVFEEITDYLVDNLIKVKNSPCSLELLDELHEEMPTHKYEYLNVLSTSLRLDCVVSSICNISRNKSEELIRQGKVQVNYFSELGRDVLLNLNNIIVIRGYGKFVINNTIGTTGSGRLKLQIKKYI